MSATPLIDLIYFDAGGGHRAAATALKQILERGEPQWQARMMHLRDVLDPVDVFRKFLRIDLQEIYNTMLRRGWTLGSEQGLRFMQQVIRLYHSSEVRLLRDWWAKSPPEMAVSVIPNFNRALFDAYALAAPGRPYVTILTDLADFPPRFWMERQPQYFICGTPKAAGQAYAMGHPKERVFSVSGMILNPRFYEIEPIDRAAGRAALGLDPARPTGLVLFGGYGTSVVSQILTRIDSSGLDVQLILIAGRNEKLRRQLESRRTRIAKHVEGFTTEVPRFMQLADFFIGKPGPGSLSEAVHMGLPCITVRNAWTLPQERYNADWLVENGFGIVLGSFADVAQAVREMLAGDRLAAMRANTRKLNNRAIFEIPPILQHIFERHS
jgi:1,2-diacylglycerol 3-beta-galactosyltransferase